MFLRETVLKRAGVEYRYWRLVKTYWDKKSKKVRHKTVASLGKLKPEEIRMFKKTISGEAGKSFSWEELRARKSFEYLGVAILDRIWKYWELDKVIADKVVEVLAINRCLSPKSDYKVSDWYKETILPSLLGETVNPTRVYRTLDEIYAFTENIQEHLYKKIRELKVDDYELIFYDITSSYFEQSECELAKYGLSRDHRRDKKQIILALAVTKKGFPFYWKVFPGNMADVKTVKEFVSELTERFGIKKACLVMDKGMVSNSNLEKIVADEFDYVVTLRRSSIVLIADMPWKHLRSIDESNVEKKKEYFQYHTRRAYYKELKQQENVRYILCFNPEKFVQERKDRKEKIESIKRYLDARNKELSGAKNKRNVEVLREEVERYLEKRAANKIIRFRLMSSGNSYQIKYRTDEEGIKEAAKLDGVWVIMSNVAEARPGEIIDAYRSRMEIERTFHSLKSFVEIRPLYHHEEERIKAHVTVCVLGYLLNNTVMHLVRKKKDFEELTAQTVYNYLRSCKLVELEAGSEKRFKITTPTEEQVKLTRVLADETLLDENRVQRL
jgi:transposase